MTSTTTKILSALAVASAAGVATHAAPVAPPPGPVANTGPTQIFSIPFNINQPGSYVLARDVMMSAGGNGININASNVTLDLGGHTMSGAGVGFEGVDLNGSLEGVTIRNGVITNWLNAAIFDSFDDDPGVVIENIRATNNGIEGIRVDGSDAVVRNCVVTNVDDQGIWVGPNSRIEGCTVLNAGDEGILAGTGSTILNCRVDNTGANVGNAGIASGPSSIVENCAAINGAGSGFAIGQGSVIRACVSNNNGVIPAAPLGGGSPERPGDTESYSPFEAYENPEIVGRNGASRQGNVTIIETGVLGSGHGFQVGLASVIENCTAGGNTGDGFNVDDNATVIGCVADNNVGCGFRLDRDSLIRDSSADANQEDGIEVSFYVAVHECVLVGNTQAGIEVVGEDNRIDTNTTVGNFGGGIVLQDNFNRVVRNDMSLDGLLDINGTNVLPPENDYTNPWTNFSD